MTQYEYEVDRGRLRDVLPHLNERSVEGWRLHTFQIADHDGIYCVAVWEREVSAG